MSPFLKCEDCLRCLAPSNRCVHPNICLDMGWLGRLFAYLFGWPRRSFLKGKQ